MSHRSDQGQKSFGDIAPTLAELTDRVLFDQVWQDPVLSRRDRSLATVASLIVMGRAEQLPFHLRRARDNGLGHDELAALTTHLAFYAGWPVAASAVTRLRELKDEEARS
jgi:4-carboxymuconolactone decarboxylase